MLASLVNKSGKSSMVAGLRVAAQHFINMSMHARPDELRSKRVGDYASLLYASWSLSAAGTHRNAAIPAGQPGCLGCMLLCADGLVFLEAVLGSLSLYLALQNGSHTLWYTPTQVCLQEAQQSIQWVEPPKDIIASKQPLPFMVSTKTHGKTSSGDTHQMQCATVHMDVGAALKRFQPVSSMPFQAACFTPVVAVYSCSSYTCGGCLCLPCTAACPAELPAEHDCGVPVLKLHAVYLIKRLHALQP